MKILKQIILGSFLALSSANNLFAAQPHHAEGGIPMSVFYAVINFFILVGVLAYFLRKPAKEFFASRATLIQTSITQAKELKIQAEKKYSEYENRLRGIQTEQKNLIESLQKDGELERQRMIQTAREQEASLKTNSERIMSQELRKAKEELKREAAAMAAEMAEKLVKENFSSQDQDRRVQQYLNKMEKLA